MERTDQDGIQAPDLHTIHSIRNAAVIDIAPHAATVRSEQDRARITNDNGNVLGQEIDIMQVIRSGGVQWHPLAESTGSA